MVHISVDASELDQLVVHFERGQSRVGRGVRPVVERATDVAETTATAKAAVDTGFMKANIDSSVAGDGRSAEVVGTVTSHAGYSDYVERGTSRMPAQPFMGPGLEAGTPVLVDGALELGVSLLGGAG